MMMAHDSTPGRPMPSAEALNALRSALEQYLTSGGETTSLQPALRRIAQEAREKKIHAEQLLIVLKDVWFALPQIARTPNERQSELLQRVVTFCIREYYST
jgi:hemoglobin-like flavoprotein